jgi:hypothetical protein
VVLDLSCRPILRIGEAPVLLEVDWMRRSGVGTTLLQSFEETFVPFVYPDCNVLTYLGVDTAKVGVLLG